MVDGSTGFIIQQTLTVCIVWKRRGWYLWWCHWEQSDSEERQHWCQISEVYSVILTLNGQYWCKLIRCFTCFHFLKLFIFEIILDSQEVAKNREGPWTLHLVSSTCYITIVQHQNQDTDMGTVCIYSAVPFYHMYAFLRPPLQSSYRIILPQRTPSC